MRIISKMALPKDNRRNVIEHSLLVSIAAGLTYLAENLGKTDFGVYTPLVVAVSTVLVTYVKKVIDNRVDNPPTPPVNPVDPWPIPTPDPEPKPKPIVPDDEGGIDFPI